MVVVPDLHMTVRMCTAACVFLHSIYPSHARDSKRLHGRSSSRPLLCICRPQVLLHWLQVLAESCKAAAENGGTAKTPQDIMMSYARSFMTSPVFKASKHWCLCPAMCSGLHPCLAWSLLPCAAASKMAWIHLT